MKLFYILVFICGNIVHSCAQNLPEIEELRLSIPNYDVARLERVENLIRDAEQLIEEARTIYVPNNDETKENAFKTMNKAAAKYRIAVSFASEVYENHINNFTENLDARYRKDLARGMHFHNRASIYFKKANDKRKTLKKLTAYENFSYTLLEIFEYERMGIINLARTLRVYQDWPIEYNYEWDDYIPPLDPLVIEDRRRDSIEAATQLNTAKKIGSADSTVIFRAQIAAHTIKMDEKYLRDRIYKGEKKINLYIGEGWYRYDIGTFYSYEEAREVVQKSGVEKAFVAAYCDNKRISMAEARQRTSFE